MTDVTIETNPEIERNWAMLAHALGLILIPFVNIAGPFLVWLIKRNRSAFIDAHAREAANFQITCSIAYFISFWLCAVFIGYLLIGIVFLTDLFLVVTAAVKAKKGESFRYPLSLRFF